eukprot:m.281886 g.281886  ORF g.281886 m.281886 type:complete len:141 (-) comp16181_c0_seq1:2140-2562(-)
MSHSADAAKTDKNQKGTMWQNEGLWGWRLVSGGAEEGFQGECGPGAPDEPGFPIGNDDRGGPCPEKTRSQHVILNTSPKIAKKCPPDVSGVRHSGRATAGLAAPERGRRRQVVSLLAGRAHTSPHRGRPRLNGLDGAMRC